MTLRKIPTAKTKVNFGHEFVWTRMDCLTQGIYSRTGNYSRTGLFKRTIAFGFLFQIVMGACKRFALDLLIMHPRAGKVDGDDRMKLYFQVV